MDNKLCEERWLTTKYFKAEYQVTQVITSQANVYSPQQQAIFRHTTFTETRRAVHWHSSQTKDLG